MNSVFIQRQLLRCQTIEQCLILDADVHKEGKPHADKGEEVGKQVFIADVLFTDDPYEGLILLIHVVPVRKRMMNTHALSQFQLPVSSDLYRPICYQFRMRHAHGLFLSQPIRTLENVSYISLAQTVLIEEALDNFANKLSDSGLFISGQCQ